MKKTLAQIMEEKNINTIGDLKMEMEYLQKIAMERFDYRIGSEIPERITEASEELEILAAFYEEEIVPQIKLKERVW